MTHARFIPVDSSILDGVPHSVVRQIVENPQTALPGSTKPVLGCITVDYSTGARSLRVHVNAPSEVIDIYSAEVEARIWAYRSERETARAAASRRWSAA